MRPAKEKMEAEVKKISRSVREGLINHTGRLKMQQLGYDYLRSKQYTDSQVKYYDDQKRPTEVFNMTFEKFNHILGESMLNNDKQRVTALSGGDPVMADIWDAYLQYIHHVNEYRMNMGKTALAGWLGGGMFHLNWTNLRQLEGSPTYTNESEFDVIWDTRSRLYFLDDAKYVARFRWMTSSDILNERAWSSYKTELKELLDDPEKSDFEWQSEWKQKNWNDPAYRDRRNGQYLIIEFHEMPWEYSEVVIDKTTQDAEILWIKDPRRRALYLDNPNLKVVEQNVKKKKITSIIPALNYYLESHYADVQDQTYDIIPYFPYPYGQFTIDFFGLMQVILGPQNFLNDMMNRTLDVINHSANAGIELVPEAYDNPEDIEDFGNQPGIVAKKKTKYIGRETMRRLDPPKLAMDSYTMVQEAKQFLEIVSTTEESVGRTDEPGAPASKYAQKIAQNKIKFAVPKFYWNCVKKRINEKLIKQAQAHITTPRLMTIWDKNALEPTKVYVNINLGDEILNNTQIGEYEVIVDDTSMNPPEQLIKHAEKMRFVEWLTSILGPQVPYAVDWDDLLKNSPMGDMSSWAEKIKQVIQGMAQAQAQESALINTNELLDTVAKNVNLQDPGLAEDSAPGKNKVKADSAKAPA